MATCPRAIRAPRLSRGSGIAPRIWAHPSRRRANAGRDAVGYPRTMCGQRIVSKGSKPQSGVSSDGFTKPE
jgi:hypothetical protein